MPRSSCSARQADTSRSLAIIDKKASTSLAPLSRGWRMPSGCVALQRMKKRVQYR